MMDVDQQHTRLRRFFFLVIGLTLAYLIGNVFYGALNQDEGWYLYSARCVMDGRIPHKDFFFTQGLGFPFIYAAFGWLWSPFGILGGRLLTAGFSVVALLITSRTLFNTTKQLAPVLVLWALLGLNLWYTYFTAIPKAYALCTLGIALALYLLTKPKAWAYCLTGVLLALLANVRLSMGILLPVVGFWLLFAQRNKAWLWFGIGGAVGLIGTLGVELLLCPEGFFEAQAFHASREAMGLFGICGCLARFIRFNPLLIFLIIFICGHRPHLREMPYVQLWLLMAVALILVHLLAPVPYDDYLIPAMLPLAMAVATLTHSTWAPYLAASALFITVVGSPIAQDWFVLRQDRFWVECKAQSDLATLQCAAKHLRKAADRLGTDTLWTQDTYLAVEAGLRVPQGLEMGPFSKPISLDVTTAQAPLAAISGYTFSMHFPDLSPNLEVASQRDALKSIYPNAIMVRPDFGQAHTLLEIREKCSE